MGLKGLQAANGVSLYLCCAWLCISSSGLCVVGERECSNDGLDDKPITYATHLITTADVATIGAV